MIIDAKKHDYDMLDRMRNENNDLGNQINTMQVLLNSCLEREEHYRQLVQRRHERQAKGGECVMS